MFQQVAVRIATAIDRREFLRTAARGTFKASALLAATAPIWAVMSGVSQAWATACENEQGPGCPFHCGPSRCCGYLNGRPPGCDCGTSGGGCKSHSTDVHCNGRNYGQYTQAQGGCWACYGAWSPCKTSCQCRKVTLCCDCTTSGCSDSSGRCISSDVYTQVACRKQSGKRTITIERVAA